MQAIDFNTHIAAALDSDQPGKKLKFLAAKCLQQGDETKLVITRFSVYRRRADLHLEEKGRIDETLDWIRKLRR